MQCPRCQTENRAGRRFCAECGAPFALPCPTCGFTNEPNEKFCGGCGTLLTSAPHPLAPPASAPQTYTPDHLADKILTSRAALEGERKQVTVLFADLTGSTELIRDLDPEAAQQLLDPALRHMMDAVHRFEGTVNQVLGDGIMALFGAPIAHEDHALRACYAALAMQSALQRYADEVRRTHGLTLRLRVGLNSGEVVVRTIGNDLHMDYSAVGQTTHLAARMEQLATPGSILLTAATLRLVEGLVRVNALGPVPVKGLAEPVDVFELVETGTIHRRLQDAAARGLTRFVGRETELVALQAALAQAEARHGQVVALVGEAGVGKSRLVYELIHSHRTQGWLVLESASVSYGKATPYSPVIDLLKRYCHLEGHDEPRTVRAKVTGQVLTLDEALQDTIPTLLALLDVLPEDSSFLKLDPPQRRLCTLAALKRVLLRESQAQPLLLVFEDLHWIDSETQALLESLVESLPTARLLLLVNYRPEYQHGWGSKMYYLQLRLDPLPPVSAEAVLDALLGDGGGTQHGAPLQALKQLLIVRTQGNPFFLEESVRTLVEAEVLVGERGAYRLVQPVESLQVPATVQAILAARIDRLSLEEKHLLQTAAVIGTEIPLPLLQASAELPEAVLHRGLARLQAAEFLYETRLFPEHEYTFKHVLTHEVAYSSLLQERRRGLHARIVEALERLAPDRLAEQVERLAHHALRGEIWDKALAYCRQAGARAAARSAYREAVTYLEQALEALAHIPSDCIREQAVDLRLQLRGALVPFAQWEQALAYLHEAEKIAADLGDQRRLGRVYRCTASDLRQLQKLEPALTYCQRAHAMAIVLGDVDTQGWVHFDMGMIHFDLGQYRRAMEHFQQTLTAFQGVPLDQSRSGTHPAIQARVWMVICLRELGEFAAGMAYGDEACQMAEVLGRPYERVHASFRVGQLQTHQGILHQAIPRLKWAMALSQEADLPNLYRLAATQLALAYALDGRATDALPLRTQVGELTYPYFNQAVYWGETYLLAGDVEEAHRLGQQGLTDARERNMRGWEARSLWLLGEIALRRDPSDLVSAEDHYQQALALAEELGMRPLQAHCHLGLGALYLKMGQQAQARTVLTAAIELYRAMDMTFWLPQAESALAQV